jgi:hypothetical protein
MRRPGRALRPLEIGMGGDKDLGGPEGLGEETCREWEPRMVEAENNEGGGSKGSGGKGEV